MRTYKTYRDACKDTLEDTHLHQHLRREVPPIYNCRVWVRTTTRTFIMTLREPEILDPEYACKKKNKV